MAGSEEPQAPTRVVLLLDDVHVLLRADALAAEIGGADPTPGTAGDGGGAGSVSPAAAHAALQLLTRMRSGAYRGLHTADAGASTSSRPTLQIVVIATADAAGASSLPAWALARLFRLTHSLPRLASLGADAHHDRITTLHDVAREAALLRGHSDLVSVAALGEPAESALDAVSGMSAAKAALLELLQVNHMLARAGVGAAPPIRLPRGALVHGPSGCGKSLLVSAVLRQEGWRTITVRGPALFDKYIGASEAALRAIFARAAAAAPCAIVFDEFDAVAARRGGGGGGGGGGGDGAASGVGDRVVNTLLTLLDGVEGSVPGVVVIALTNRPLAIDPALRRPGRLDLDVECPPPSASDRAAIMREELRRCGVGVADDAAAALVLAAACREMDGASGAAVAALLRSARSLAVAEAVAADGCPSPPSVMRLSEEVGEPVGEVGRPTPACGPLTASTGAAAAAVGAGTGMGTPAPRLLRVHHVATALQRLPVRHPTSDAGAPTMLLPSTAGGGVGWRTGQM